MQPKILPAMRIAAIGAGNYLRQEFAKDPGSFRKKRPLGSVIDVLIPEDRAAEDIIRKSLNRRIGLGKEIGFVGEEGTSLGNDKKYFLVDPNDGSKNFSKRLGAFAVSIAFVENGEIVAAVILLPQNGRLYQAVKGKGSQRIDLDIRRGRLVLPSCFSAKLLRVKQQKAKESLVAVEENFGNTKGKGKEVQRSMMARLKKSATKVAGVRKFGSSAFDLCLLAEGCFGAVMSLGVKSWDIAGGVLIASEAGAKVTDYSGNRQVLKGNSVFAATPSMYRALRSVVSR